MTPGLPFTKMQAVGNDFVVIEEAVWGATTDWAQAAIRLCNRHNGIGGDGLLVVCPSEVADLRMRMFNPDGTEDMCGNGLRCVAWWALDRGYWRVWETSNLKEGMIETIVGVRHIAVETSDDVFTDMGTPQFRVYDLPMLLPDRDTVFDYPLTLASGETIAISAVNTGTTHTVIWVDELPGDARFFAVSPQIENHSLFPERTSVIWAKPVSGGAFEVRIWERGAGETLGCGTGACAVAVLAMKQNKIKRIGVRSLASLPVTIRSRGGSLKVSYTYSHVTPPHEAITLIGTAHTVHSGVVFPTM